MALATLSIDLEARLGRLERDLAGATALIERQSTRMQRQLGGLNDVFKGSLAADFVGDLARRFTQLVPSIIDGIDALNDVADATGSTVENISALEDIARRTGGTLDTVSTSLVRFNAKLSDAKQGSETAEVLQRIGLSAQELRRLDPADALLRTAQALATYRDDGDKARIVQDLFGKSTLEVAKFLKDLAERGQLTAKVTSDQAREAQKFNDELAKMGKNATDLSRVLAGPLVKSVNDTIEKFREGQAAGKGFFELYAEWVRRSWGIGQQDMAPGSRNRPSMFPDFTDPGISSELARLQARQSGAAITLKPSVGPAPEKAGRPAVDEALRYIEALQRQLASTRELTAAEKVLADIQAGRFKGSKAATEAQALAVARDIDATREAIRVAEERAAQRNKDYEDANAAARANEEADRSRLKGLLDNTQTEQFKKLQNDIDFLREKLYAGRIDAEQYGEAVAAMIERIGDQARATRGIFDDIGSAFGGALEDAILDGEKLSTIFQRLDKQIAAILVREWVTKPAASAISGAASSVDWGAIIGSLLSNANGNAFGPGGVQRFAMGGVVDRPTLFRYGGGRMGVMGEAGAEGVLPLARGRDGRLGVRAQGGGGTHITVNMNGSSPGGADRRTAMQQGEIIGRQVRLAMVRNG